MTITSVGYAGTVDDVDWPLVTRLAGGASYNLGGPGDFNATPGVGDRAVRIAAGVAAGAGVVDTSDAAETLLLPSVASGDRWDLIGLRRHWATGVSSVVRVGGGASKAIPSRPNTPGVEDVQPLWLCRVRAGQTAVQEFVDLRVWVGDGGAYANDDLVRSYIDRVGTYIQVGAKRWARRIGTTGAAVWAPLYTQGIASGVTGGGGELSIAHGLGVVPSRVLISDTTGGAAAATRLVKLNGKDASTFQVLAYNGGAVFGVNVIEFEWVAFA